MSYEAGLCEDAFRLCVELVRHRALSMAHWQCCLPYMFVGLLSKSEALRNQTLGRLHKVWVALERAEMMRHKSVVVAQLLDVVPVSRQGPRTTHGHLIPVSQGGVCDFSYLALVGAMRVMWHRGLADIDSGGMRAPCGAQLFMSPARKGDLWGVTHRAMSGCLRRPSGCVSIWLLRAAAKLRGCAGDPGGGSLVAWTPLLWLVRLFWCCGGPCHSPPPPIRRSRSSRTSRCGSSCAS